MKIRTFTPPFFYPFAFLVFLLLVAGCATTDKDPLDRPAAELMEAAENELAAKSYEEAREYLDAVKGADPEKKFTAKAQLRKADSYFEEESYPEAAVEYEAFLDFHIYHEDAPYAQYRLALSYFNQIDSVDRGYENIVRARTECRKLLKNYPRNPYREVAEATIARCDNMLAEYEEYVGSFYLKKGSYRAAIGRFEKLLKDFPASSVEQNVLLMLGEAYQGSGEREKAQGILSSLIQKYPASSQAARARDLLDTLGRS